MAKVKVTIETEEPIKINVSDSSTEDLALKRLLKDVEEEGVKEDDN